jgi:putative ABC transport system permease protein
VNWLHRVFHKSHAEKSLDKELQFHLDRQIADYVAAGMRPEEARRRARLEFGALDCVKEEVRDTRWEIHAENLLRDFRHALRAMRTSVPLTAVAILSLALGIGATTAIFSILYALMLKPLPVLQPDRLIEVARSDGVNLHSYATWQQIRDKQDIFSGVFAYNTWDTRFSLTDGDEKRGVSGLYVTGDFFRTLGVPAILGRTLQASDDQPGALPVCVIGYGLWRRQYGQSRSVIGRTIVLDGHPFQLVGVTPRSFFGLEVGNQAEVFIPLEAERLFKDYQLLPNGRATPTLDSSVGLLTIVARMSSGVNLTQADARLRILGPEVYKALPPVAFSRGTFIARPMPNGISFARDYNANSVLLLMTMAGVALLIACANLGNLLLARATKRQGEMATRFALGATRWRLIQQLLIESLVLSFAGAVVGLVVEHWGSKALLVAFSIPLAPVVLDLSWDAKLVAFTVGTTLLCAVLFGLGPAIQATRLQLYSAMKNDLATGMGRHRVSNAVLIVVQVALSMALLVSAGLLTRTLQALLAKDPGYEAKGVSVVQIGWEGTHESPERQTFEGIELLRAFRALPEVLSASGIAPSGGTSVPSVIISQPGGSERRPLSFRIFVSPGFFTTRRTPMLSGRDFNDSDNEVSPPVAVLSEQAARTFFPRVNPIGLRYREREESGENKGQEYSIEVVGVAKDIDYQRPYDSPLAMVYKPVSQCAASCAPISSYEVRFADPSADASKRLKDLVATVDSQLSVELHLLDDERNGLVQRNRGTALIATFFGLFTGLLAMIGVYGVTSYATSQRTREIGIRMALGAQPSNMFRMVLGETVTVVLIGVACGIVAGLAVARAIQGMIWGVKATDPLSFFSAASGMLVVAGIAAFIPARRAMRVDPMVALRYE